MTSDTTKKIFSRFIKMNIRIDDLSSPAVAQLLAEHMHDMHLSSPPGSIHALELEKLKAPEITFWTAWEGNELAGCGAIKSLDADLCEIKSMRTAKQFRGKGVGSLILETMLDFARSKGYQRVSLETGTSDYFLPAQKFYQKLGFHSCEPFGSYAHDPNSLYMTLEL